VWRQDQAIPGAPLRQSATAVKVMQLVEQGRMSLDDPVALPAGATIRQVLSQTADGSPGEEYLYNQQFLASLPAMVATIKAPSSIEELTKYAIRLDGNQLISEKSKAAMFTPVKSTHGAILACGLGWFSQTFSGERLVWDFAQTEESSTLLVMVPARRLTVIVLGDSKTMTEAAHLEDGNIARSAIALAFLEDIVFERAFPRDEMENRAIEAFYFGKPSESAAIVRDALEKFPELESADDLTLLGLLSQLHSSATEASATAVVLKHPYIPTAWLYYGSYLRNSRRFRESTICFEQITEHRPPWHHWSVLEAQKELSTLQ
jgi:hypothetical protein